MHKAIGLYAHVTWHTKWRERTVDQDRAAVIRACIVEAAERTGVHVHAIGVLSDHVHVVLSYNPAVALAGFIRHAKSESARRINLTHPANHSFRWCRGYYAGSLSRTHVRAAITYVRRQFARHPNLVPALSAHNAQAARVTPGPSARG